MHYNPWPEPFTITSYLYSSSNDVITEQAAIHCVPVRIKAESSDRGARVPPAAAIEATAMFNNALVPSSTNKLNDKLAYTCPGSDCWCLGFGSLLRPNISLNAPARWIVYEVNVHIFCIGLASVLGAKLHRNVPRGGVPETPGLCLIHI